MQCETSSHPPRNGVKACPDDQNQPGGEEESIHPDRVLVILGHPRKESFCAALADSYMEQAKAQCSVKTLCLADMQFDPDVHMESPANQHLEPDLALAQESILWANHIVFVFPTWWGTMPALLKGFLDRVLTPGFAFSKTEKGYKPLLGGRSAHLITIMDTPEWVYRFIYRSPGVRAISVVTLQFCGIRPVRITKFAGVKHSTPDKREEWKQTVRREADRVPVWKEKIRCNAGWLQWFRIARLHFYAMTLLAYGLGAKAATVVSGDGWHWPVFWTGFAVLFLIEFASVLTNELHDLPSDLLNKKHGPFTGGSRVLVNQGLSSSEVSRVRWVAAATAYVAGCALAVFLAPGPGFAWFVLIALGLVLGIGYTAPPLKLCWRGWGELNVAVTHSLYMVLCGWVLQSGAWNDPTPWLLALPMGLAVFAAILLAGIPDFDADKAVGKRTLAVRLGVPGAAKFALAAVLAAAVSGIVLVRFFNWETGWVIPLLFSLHAIGLAVALVRFHVRNAVCRRIDGLLVIALAFILWLSLVPLFAIK